MNEKSRDELGADADRLAKEVSPFHLPKPTLTTCINLA